MPPNKEPIRKSPTCFFDPSTCQQQRFSIPEKIVYYIARNVTNATTFQKLVETCKYFYKVNPVIVVQYLQCCGQQWYGDFRKYSVGFKYDQPINFKIWITDEFSSSNSGHASKVIPLIYKNDAKNVTLLSQPLEFEDFLFFVGNAEELLMLGELVKFKNGEIVQLEDIVKNLPKIKYLCFQQCIAGSDVNSNTGRKLMEIENFKNISELDLDNVSEALDVEQMFNLILENRKVSVNLCYRNDISDACKELVRKYSNLLGKQNGCNSKIRFIGMNDGNFDELSTSSSEDSDTSLYSSDDDENEDLLFPWNNEEDAEWELPWDKNE